MKSSDSVSVIAAEADEIFEGGDVPHVTKDEISPEVRLWRAVLLLTWQDAFVHSAWVLCGKAGGAADRDEIAERERKKAIRWLTLDYGRWREDRELICDLAGIDSELVRRLALARLAQIEKPKESTVDRDALARRARVDLDRLLNQLLSRADLDDADVDSLLAEIAEMECELAPAA